MNDSVAIIGAGPSGLAAEKAMLEYGLRPTVFEKASAIGGLWRPGTGYTWSTMRTNLSKWTCAFSDHPWPQEAEDFPPAAEVHGYISSYADKFGLSPALRLGEKVESVIAHPLGWSVNTTRQNNLFFDHLIVASGIFAEPYMPSIEGAGGFPGRILHSGYFQENLEFGQRVVVLGGSLSGVEIAAHLAAHGAEVFILFEKAPWILPKYALSNDRKVPLDLILYRRTGEEKQCPDEKYLNSNQRLLDNFGNPGRVHPALTTYVDANPPYVAISDSFLSLVESGQIHPMLDTIVRIENNVIVTTHTEIQQVEEIILCTGYQSNLEFMPQETLKVLEYDKADTLVPYIACRSLFHPDLPRLYFTGLYKGPYFGVIELQARLAASLISKQTRPIDSELARELLEQERRIRTQRPRLQFPHGNYVEFADELAMLLGCSPGRMDDSALDDAVRNGPVTPFQYRLQGPYSKRDEVSQAVLSAYHRVKKLG